MVAIRSSLPHKQGGFSLRLRDTRARAVQNVLGNVYLISLTKNLRYEECEQLDSGGGGALSQAAGHDGSFYRYAVESSRPKTSSSVHQKAGFTAFLERDSR